ncbi:lipid II flippase MurJ [Photobacterium sp. 2_MG-2023]|uniref:lipid II flippase MurJ n=1 Tax=Photobacterium sp. 2_MG-2023 TaxID=3062663 RepID=UPI0026E21EC1|nr:lipid II flippase MurJ [Photobacterium sp. 2_MG-2023]MDO6579741.1 lipid II flippase MurJ [Photobacterium sp. 2_MG-2023]
MLRNYSLLFSLLIVNFSILLGRFSGFIREITIAELFGVSYNSDLAILLLTLPDILINLLVGGALSAAIMPLLAKESYKVSKVIICQLFFFFFFAFVAVSIILCLFNDEVIGLIAPGYKNEGDAISSLFLSSYFTIPFCVLTGVSTAYLQFNNKFIIPSLGTLIFNSTIILFLFFSDYYSVIGTLSIIYGLYLAVTFRYLSQLLVLDIWSGFKSIFKRWYIDSDFIRKYIQAMASGSIIFLLPVICRSVASNFSVGSVSLINYSMRLTEFIIVFSVSCISIVFFPKLTKSFRHSKTLFKDIAQFLLLLVLLISSTLSVCLYLNASEFVNVIFGSSLEKSDLDEVAELTSIGLLAVSFQSASLMVMSIFNAASKNKYPLIANLTGIIVLVITLYFYTPVDLIELMMSLLGVYILIFLIYMYLAISKLDFSFGFIFSLLLKCVSSVLIVILMNYIFNFSGISNYILQTFIPFIIIATVFLLLNKKKIKGMFSEKI